MFWFVYPLLIAVQVSDFKPLQSLHRSRLLEAFALLRVQVTEGCLPYKTPDLLIDSTGVQSDSFEHKQ